MKPLDGSRLLESIKQDLTPRDEYEAYERIHTGIPVALSMEDMIQKLNVFTNKGYSSIKFISQHQGTQTIELKKDRSPEELVQYRIEHVERRILRWVRDGLVRFKKIAHDKEIYINSFRDRMKSLEERHIPIPSEMNKKFDLKQARLDYYLTTIKKMEHILEFYPEYSFEELCSLNEIIFSPGGNLK